MLANETWNGHQFTILNWFVLHAAKGFVRSITTQNDAITAFITLYTKGKQRKTFLLTGKQKSLRTKYHLKLMET